MMSPLTMSMIYFGIAGLCIFLGLQFAGEYGMWSIMSIALAAIAAFDIMLGHRFWVLHQRMKSSENKDNKDNDNKKDK
ncbi:DUF4305 domain-containing protein [Sinobaca sp. H24]|uniref:DUF4305 domain-containing protein n=1 Tax=Sinobaca sp. H24 TaxID=2923376 RepID=UPI00207A686E|nr:DUF4305 domain-containing protein [Sinobaca sp. H24]